MRMALLHEKRAASPEQTDRHRVRATRRHGAARQDDDRHDNGIQANNHDDPANEPGFYIRKGHVH